ncbi:MAG: prolyl oligopeptidase family serine peptidase [Candidatus Alcyoniella australis]|nr:prolyl oligopeptidase family serine peptidase [Candidatus Alcyoniella australis]
MSISRLTTLVLVAFLIACPTLCAAQDDGFANYLQISYARGGSLSPEGSRLVYLDNGGGTYQVYLRDLTADQSAPPRQLTDFAEPVEFAVYLPTRERVLIGSSVGGNERTQLLLLDPATGEYEALTSAPEVIHRFGCFSRDGRYIAYAANARDQAHFDIYVMDMNTREARRVLTRDGYNDAESFSPDGKQLVVSSWESNYDNNLYLLDLGDGEMRLLTKHVGWATYEYPRFDRKGKHLWLTSNYSQNFNNPARIKLRNGKLRFERLINRETEALVLSEDPQRLAYVINDDGYSMLMLWDPKGWRELELPQIPRGVIRNLSISPDGTKLAFSLSSPTLPSSVFVVDIEARNLRMVSVPNFAGIDPTGFVEPELIKYQSADGKSVPAFLYVPPGVKADGSNPALIYAHGGPEGQERPDFGITFQYFLSRGYLIFAPNPRGSAGYGKLYIHADDKDKRPAAVADYAWGAKWLVENNWADQSKIGIYGGSYGGYVVMAMLAQFPQTCAAGVSFVGISNLVSFLQNTGAWRRAIREAEYGSLEFDLELLQRISPINKVELISSPLMVIQGANDPRVPQQEADQIVAALRARNVPVEYLLYADEGHGLAKRKNRLEAYPKMGAFFDLYLRGIQPEPEKQTEQNATDEDGEQPPATEQ